MRNQLCYGICLVVGSDLLWEPALPANVGGFGMESKRIAGKAGSHSKAVFHGTEGFNNCDFYPTDTGVMEK